MDGTPRVRRQCRREHSRILFPRKVSLTDVELVILCGAVVVGNFAVYMAHQTARRDNLFAAAQYIVIVWLSMTLVAIISLR